MIKEAIFQKLWSDSQNHQREVVGVGESGACENLRIIRGRWWEWERVEHVRAGYKTRVVVTHVAIATS